MKVQVSDYAHACPGILKTLGFETLKVYEMSKEELLQKASDALDLGVGILIRPTSALESSVDLVFHIDSANGKFRQR